MAEVTACGLGMAAARAAKAMGANVERIFNESNVLRLVLFKKDLQFESEDGRRGRQTLSESESDVIATDLGWWREICRCRDRLCVS